MKSKLETSIASKFISTKVNSIAIAIANLLLELSINEISTFSTSQVLANWEVKIVNKPLQLEIWFPVIDLLIAVTESGKLLLNLAENDFTEIDLGVLVNVYRNKVNHYSITKNS
ncbi:hypothetical protein Xen7305DRAFT_00008830 [Xenococcus sp. PCC 7305]|uniref:hypothetical protein n=1 Tax=Xenococcus sp. PCC 7305 TaxID=102125 RepID=UPI0002AC6E8F|nr:hypothetical protein [Xenococcus sp. PCC 7305]ELS01181.1 hypothetical protein Xen7305DRAFT_00008830 [Xenococcus sp. PCC 7305]